MRGAAAEGVARKLNVHLIIYVDISGYIYPSIYLYRYIYTYIHVYEVYSIRTYVYNTHTYTSIHIGVARELNVHRT